MLLPCAIAGPSPLLLPRNRLLLRTLRLLLLTRLLRTLRLLLSWLLRSLLAALRLRSGLSALLRFRLIWLLPRLLGTLRLLLPWLLRRLLGPLRLRSGLFALLRFRLVWLLPRLLGTLRLLLLLFGRLLSALLLRSWSRLRALLLRLRRLCLGPLLLGGPGRRLLWLALLLLGRLGLLFLGISPLAIGGENRAECKKQGSGARNSNKLHSNGLHKCSRLDMHADGQSVSRSAVPPERWVATQLHRWHNADTGFEDLPPCKAVGIAGKISGLVKPALVGAESAFGSAYFAAPGRPPSSKTSCFSRVSEAWQTASGLLARNHGRTLMFQNAPANLPDLRDLGADQPVILVADDDALIRNLVTLLLQHEGYFVLSAADGHEGLQLSRQYPGAIRLLITDMQMPRLNGADLSAHLLEERPGIKVMIMSGADIGEIVSQNANLLFLPKPFDGETLKARVRAILAPPVVK